MLGIFLDTETNGLNSKKHRILEIAYKIIDLSTGEDKESFNTIVSQPKEIFDKSDPESLKINGFTWHEVSFGKSEETVKQMIIQSFGRLGISRKNAVFICQNPSFDRVFFAQLIDSDFQESLQWPYHWLDLASMYWAYCMLKAKEKSSPFPWETGVSKDLIATSLHISKEKKPHRASNGVDHLILCYKNLLGFPFQ